MLENPQGSQWCDQRTITTNLFFCDVEKAQKISASKICDGRKDCPEGQDESNFICRPSNHRAYSAFSLYSIFATSMGVVAYYLKKTKEKKKCVPKIKHQTIEALACLKNYVLLPNEETEARLKTTRESMDLRSRVKLLEKTYNMDLQGKNVSVQLMKTVVEKMFAQEEKSKMLALVKASNMPTACKKKILDLVNMGCITKIKESIDQTITSKCCGTAAKNQMFAKMKIVFFMVVSITESTLGLLMVPLSDLKDLWTALSFWTFYLIVLQERTVLVDQVPVYEIILLFAVIFLLTFLLKMVNAVQEKPITEERKCFPLNFKVNPAWIPFFSQCLFRVQEIKNSLKVFKLQWAIQAGVSKICDGIDSSEETKLWEEMCLKSAELNDRLIQIEAAAAKRKNIKVPSILGDVLQAMVLFSVLLRTDLRIRSVLQTGSFSKKLGPDVEGKPVTPLIHSLNI